MVDVNFWKETVDTIFLKELFTSHRITHPPLKSKIFAAKHMGNGGKCYIDVHRTERSSSDVYGL